MKSMHMGRAMVGLAILTGSAGCGGVGPDDPERSVPDEIDAPQSTPAAEPGYNPPCEFLRFTCHIVGRYRDPSTGQERPLVDKTFLHDEWAPISECRWIAGPTIGSTVWTPCAGMMLM